MFSQMRDVLQEQGFVLQADVVAQDEVLVNLAHVADMRHNRYAKIFALQAQGQKLADARDAYLVDLNVSGALRKKVVFKDHPVRHVLADRKVDGRYRLGQRPMAEDVVCVCGFLDPKRVDLAQLRADFKRLGKRAASSIRSGSRVV